MLHKARWGSQESSLKFYVRNNAGVHSSGFLKCVPAGRKVQQQNNWINTTWHLLSHYYYLSVLTAGQNDPLTTSFSRTTVHTPNMHHQFVFPGKSPASSTHTASTGWSPAPVSRFIGSVKCSMMASELGLASECTACAFLVVAYEFAVVKYGADLCNSVFGVGRLDYRAGRLALFLCHVYRSVC